MYSVQVNIYAVLLAGLSSMVVGMLYYSDRVFGKRWKKLGGIDAKRFEKEISRTMPIMFLAALVTAFAVAYFSFLYHQYFLDSWLSAGLLTSLALWLGVSATSLSVHSVLDQKPAQLLYISLGNRLLSMAAMGLIIGWLHP